MSAPAIDDDNHFGLLEMDSPSGLFPTDHTPIRNTAAIDVLHTQIAATQAVAQLRQAGIELDLTNAKSPTCLQCKLNRPVDEQSVCQSCRNTVPHAVALTLDDNEFGAPVTTLTQDLAAIAAGGAANAAVTGIGSQRAGTMRGVGFSSREGYIQAIRNGVPGHTHESYMQTLRVQYGLTTADIAALALPGPMAVTALPDGAGIKHTPTGPSVFDLPKAQRAFVVAPSQAQQEAPARIDITSKEMVAGAVAEGHHAIVAWEGTSGMTRGALVGALAAIERADWAPRAPNARAQAGSAINTLASGGLLVRAMRKGAVENELATGEHVWTCGRVNHTGSVGDNYGEVLIRFKLSGATLTFEGPENIGAAVVASFEARMSEELFKSSDVTSWLSRALRWRLDGVRFGALGWLIPAKHAAAAKQLTEAVANAGFGAGWVHGLPVATSDQLRDGIVRGLVTEVDEVTNAIRAARIEARGLRASFIASGEHGKAPSGDIGQTRAATYLKELRAIAGRVVAYGQVLGEERVDRARRVVREAMAELETVLGEDYSGIRERFGLIWEEIELDRKRAGGVL